MSEIEKLLDRVEDSASSLSISHDSPDKEMLMEWFEEYFAIKTSCGFMSTEETIDLIQKLLNNLR